MLKRLDNGYRFETPSFEKMLKIGWNPSNKVFFFEIINDRIDDQFVLLFCV